MEAICATTLPLSSSLNSASSASSSVSASRTTFLAGSFARCGSSQNSKQSSTRQARAVAPRAQSVEVAEADAAALNATFSGEGVAVGPGEGGLPRVTLSGADGSSVEIYLYGGVPTSWKLPSGEDLLYVRPDAVFTGQKPISGGIPHCFPQFGPGPMQQHGFARNLSWELASAEHGPQPAVTLRLVDNDYSRAMWDYSFEALFKISLGASQLTTELTINNTDTKPFEFTAALHSYFRGDISAVKVSGLKGCDLLNKDPDPKNPIPGVEERDEVTFPGFVDCMYLSAPSSLVLDNGLGTKLSIESSGWNDAVVWSPYLTMEACYKEFVCVENAQLKSVTVEPGQSWTAVQKLAPQ